MWILLLLVPFSLLGLASCVVLGGPRRYALLTGVLALLVMWGWSHLAWWAALVWLALYAGLRFSLLADYDRRRKGTDAGATGEARYLSFLPQDKSRQGLVVWLPPLKAPLYWAVKRMKRPLPAAGGGPTGELLLPVLNQVFGNSRGFRIDTRHLPGGAGPAMLVRCD